MTSVTPRRGLPVLLALLVVLAATAVATGAVRPAGAGGPAGGQTPGGPGAGPAGVVGAEGERVDGLATRTSLERDLAAAPSDDASARVLARYLAAAEARLATLERRHERLAAGLENGSLPADAYRSRARTVWAGARSVSRLGDAIEAAAADLPAASKRAAGVEAGAVAALAENATALAERSRPPGAGDTGGAGVYADVERVVAGYNESVADAGRVGRQLRGERVELVIETDGPDAVVSFRVDQQGRFTDLRAGERGDVSVRLRTDRRTVGRLAEADDTAGALRRAVAADDVSVHGVGPANAVKWAVLDWLAGA